MYCNCVCPSAAWVPHSIWRALTAGATCSRWTSSQARRIYLMRTRWRRSRNTWTSWSVIGCLWTHGARNSSDDTVFITCHRRMSNNCRKSSALYSRVMYLMYSNTAADHLVCLSRDAEYCDQPVCLSVCVCVSVSVCLCVCSSVCVTPWHTYVSSSYRSNRLALSHWDPYAVRRGGCLELYYCNMVEWFWWDSNLISTTNWFPSVL